MATYYPDWLPVAADMPDIEEAYQASVPQQWPMGLRFPETDLDYERQAIGICISWVPESLWLITRYYFPRSDTEGFFLDRWETALALQNSGSIADRQNRITSKMRNRGTGIEDIIFSIIAPAYGVPEGSSKIQFSTPDMSTIIADDPPKDDLSGDDNGWLDAFTGHFFADGTLTLGRDMVESILLRMTPAGWRWTAGETQYLKCTTIPLDEGVLS